jgi:predicted dehydrogenase
VLDTNSDRAAEAAAAHGCPILASLDDLAQRADAAVVASPTSTHAAIGCRLMELGLDVMIEKPIAHSIDAGRQLVETAERTGRILQVGHLERFNPAVIALEAVITQPLFFEVHRLSEFSPRSLDVDVVLDLMIHDIDIILTLTGQPPEEIRAAGIHILSEKVDIANVRMQFPGGCVANLTASRVSTERVRKMRFFQQHEYISLDYARRDALRIGVKKPGPQPEFGFEKLNAPAIEPLHAELEAFLNAVRSRKEPRTNGAAGRAALELAGRVMASIQEHAARVQIGSFTAQDKTR